MITPAELLLCLDRVCEAAAALPEIGLLPGERMLRAASCPADAQELVGAVRRALVRRPELFPDVGDAPAAVAAAAERLGGRMDRSAIFLVLARCFQRLERLAHDGYLLDRSLAVSEAMQIVEQVRQTGRLRYPQPRREERAAALRLAERVLSRRQAARRRKAGRKAPAAGPPAAGVPGERAAGEPPQHRAVKDSPQRRAAAAARRRAAEAPPAAALPPPAADRPLSGSTHRERPSASPGREPAS